jgi:hypothetical protein
MMVLVSLLPIKFTTNAGESLNAALKRKVNFKRTELLTLILSLMSKKSLLSNKMKLNLHLYEEESINFKMSFST